MELAEIAELQRERDGLTAAAGPPLVPPRPWFEKEEPDDGPVAWTVTADGQVFGHAAVWGTCHTGKPGKCITPPKSRSDYAYYKTGLTEVDDGELIPTGRITLGTGHASLTASPAATAEHYDNTGAVVADVTVRDGKHGIWVTGALRPGVTPERARELRGASLSGDWRSIRGALEMLGLLAVNVPGFPVPRALAASGADDEVLALVAAGIFADDVQILPETEDHELEAEFKALYAAAMKRSDAFMSKKQKVKDALCATAAVNGQPILVEVEAEFLDEIQWLLAEEAGDELTAAASPGRARARKIAKVLREFKAGTLKDSNGNVVTNRKQALAIALSESRHLTADARAAEIAEQALALAAEDEPGVRAAAKAEEDDEDVEEVAEDAEEEPDDEDAEEEDEEEEVTAAAECDECEPEAVEDFPGELILAASFTQGQRERLAKKGEAMSDGSFPIRNRGDLRNAVQSVGRASDPEAAKRWIIKRARALKAIGDLPASWNITAAAWDESKHPRHPEGTADGGQFAPKGTSKLAPRRDEAEAAVENRRTMGGKLIRGPGGKLMSRTEAGVLLDKAEGRRAREPVSSMSPDNLPPKAPPKLASQGPGEQRDYSAMSVGDLADEIEREWSSQKGGVNFAARPYLDAMKSLDTFDDSYGADSGRSIGAYFISNASQFRGEKAKALKAELKKRLGLK